MGVFAFVYVKDTHTLTHTQTHIFTCVGVSVYNLYIIMYRG